MVPTTTPEGKPIRTRYHRVWDAKVREIANGLTILKPCKGQWLSLSGDLHEERVIPVEIACTEEEINKISDMTAVYYRQLCVMITEVAPKVIMKHYDPKNGYKLKIEPIK